MKMWLVLVFFIVFCAISLESRIVNERNKLRTKIENLETKIEKLENKSISLQYKLDETQLLTCSIGNQVTRIADIIISHAETDDTNTPKEIREMGKVEEMNPSNER